MKGFYNPDDGKIYNCKKGSKTWYHELRHKQQYIVAGWLLKKLDFLQKMLLYAVALFYTTNLFIRWDLLTTVNALLFIVLIKLTLIDLALEIDAELYSWRKYGKKN